MECALSSHDHYASFMLRLHWVQNGERFAWVASTQSTRTGELRWFPNLEAFVRFIRDEFRDYEAASDSDAVANTT
jgi:hypothetical protein